MSDYIAPDGCRVYYEVAGEGPCVVLIPGLGGDGRFWTGVIPHLIANFRLVVVDHRGAGRSGRPETGYSLAAIVADVLGILDQEKLISAHVIGHSTGGAITQLMALAHPARVLSCVFSSSWCRSDARFRMLFALRERLLRDGDAPAYQVLTHLLGYTPEWIEMHQAELEEAVLRADETLFPLGVQIARIRMLLDHDVEAQLGSLLTPALVVGAVDDVLLPLVYSQKIAAVIPGAKLVTVSGGHFHPRTRPKEFSCIVRAFLYEHANAPLTGYYTKERL